MNKKLLTTSVFLATSIAMAFEPWIGSKTPTPNYTPYYVNTGLANETNTAGYWFVKTDEVDGGKSKVVWPVNVKTEADSLAPVIDFCKGVCGTADLDKGNLTYKPFVSVGFNVVGEGAEGKPAPGNAYSWGGICITFRSDVAPSLELSLGDYDATIEYALPAISFAQSINGEKYINGESYRTCIPWSDFKQPAWYREATKISGTEAAAQLVSINFKMQGAKGQYKFNICAIGPYGEKIEGEELPTGAKSLPTTCNEVITPFTHPAISVNAKWSKGNDGYDATITVKDGEKELTEGTDYEIESNVNDATGIVIKTITGKGDYTGSVVKSLVPYIDENGKPQVMYDATVLTSDVTDYIENGVINLPGGWYVVQGEVKYTSQVKFIGDAHLILADGATIEIETGDEHGIYASNNLTIYGQSNQNGILKATGSSYGINGYNVTISGGSVTATGNYNGIYSDNGVTISGGMVEATGENGDGIYSDNGVTISGGTVTASGNSSGINIKAGHIALGWTNSTDFIKVSSIHLGADSCTVSIAEGKSFKDENGKAYRGTLTGEQLSAIEGKKLEPCYAVTFDAQNGDDPIMLLTTFDENGVAHAAKPNDPIRSGFTFEGWFDKGDSEFDFTKAVKENTTAYAHWNENTPVEYIDENGETNETKNYILLTNDINVDNLPGGWYVVQSEVKYTSQVTFNGEAHLILADDAKMEIKSEDFGIYANENLTIYGQGGQSGTLNVTALDEIMGSSSSTGVFSDGNITINGGSVTATSTNGVGIYSDNGVTISGGSVTATGKNGEGIYSYNGGVTISGGSVTAYGYYDGIYSDNGGVTISGGSVTATGENDNGIYSYNGGVTISGGSVTATGENDDGINTRAGHITLGWTNSTDFIKASSYYSEKGTVSIAGGNSFKDENGKEYSGTLTGEQLSAIKGNKLEPCYAVTFDAQNGDDPIMLLTTFDENGVAHAAKPADPIRSGFTFEGWFDKGDSEFDFTKAVKENTTAYAHWNENTPVEYIDENGGTKKTKNYILLTNDINVDNLPGGWYVVQSEVKYTSQVTFNGEAHLILADGAEMNVNAESDDASAIFAEKNLTIYGQSGQSGVLKATCEGHYDEGGCDDDDLCISGEESGIYSDGNIAINGGVVTASCEDYGIYSGERLLINGGKVEVSSEIGDAVSCESVTINGGEIAATGKFDGIYSVYITINGGKVSAASEYDGIYGDEGFITINGGEVTAIGKEYGISSNGASFTIAGGNVTATGGDYGIDCFNENVILSLTNSTDRIKVSSFNIEDGEIIIADGKSLKDENGKEYSGTIDDVSDIAGKTLVPPSFEGKFLSGVNIAVADIPVQKYADGKPVCPSVVVTDGKDTLTAGTDYTVTCVNNTAVTSANLDEAAIAQITGKGNYAGAIQKRFFIWENIGNYAAVQVYKDKKGDSHAEIDGAYDGTDAVAIDENFENVAVKFNREFTVNLENGGFSTIMLPFDVSASNLTGVKSIFEFDDVDNNAVGVKYVWCNATIGKQELEKGNPDCSELSGELKAYTPYMVEMETPTLGFKDNVTLKPSNNATNSVVSKSNWVFRGALKKKEWSKEDDDIKNGQIWAFAGSARNGASIGKFVQFGGNNWVNPFRAYLVDCTKYPDASECKDETQPEPSFVSRYRFADVLAPATSAENSLSAKKPMGVAASETALLNSMDIVIVYGDKDSTGGKEHTTVIGRMNPATGEIRMLPRTTQTYDLKGRRVNSEKRNARGAYYGKHGRK